MTDSFCLSTFHNKSPEHISNCLSGRNLNSLKPYLKNGPLNKTACNINIYALVDYIVSLNHHLFASVLWLDHINFAESNLRLAPAVGSVCRSVTQKLPDRFPWNLEWRMDLSLERTALPFCEDAAEGTDPGIDN